MKRRRRGAVAAGVLLLSSASARADGSGSHGETLRTSGSGIRVTTAAVGLSGRRPGAPSVPLEEANLVLAGMPDGAVVQKAYLYWVTYGTDGNASITLGGTNLTGTLIGGADDTCWEETDTWKNFVYRADVSAQISANGTFEVTNFPSGLVASDTQGASLFVVYRDPSDPMNGAVYLRDGAIVIRPGSAPKNTFGELTIPEGFTKATFRVGVGDGEAAGLDGALNFNGSVLPAPDSAQHYKSTAGNYWDAPSYDVTTRVAAGTTTIDWTQGFQSDCLVLAYAALDVQSPFVDAGVDDDAGSSAADAGGNGGSSSSSSSSGTTSTSDGGSLGITPGGSAADDSEGGCGCRTNAAAASPLASMAGLALAVSLLLRRRSTRR